jgi:Transposase DDE domain
MRNHTLFYPVFASFNGESGADSVSAPRAGVARRAGQGGDPVHPALGVCRRGQRQSVSTPFITFCSFLGLVLQRDASCREAVRRVQASCHALAPPEPDDNTSGYCQARLRLSVESLRRVHDSLVQKRSRRIGQADLWRGYSVKVIDGYGLSTPETDENPQVYAYAGGQKPGCGFPTGKLVELFSLSGGHLIRFVQALWKNHELKLARQLVDSLRPREVLLGDRGFCGWGFIALLKLGRRCGPAFCTKHGRSATGAPAGVGPNASRAGPKSFGRVCPSKSRSVW